MSNPPGIPDSSSRVVVVVWVTREEAEHWSDPYGTAPWQFKDACRAALARPEGEAWEGWQAGDGENRIVTSEQYDGDIPVLVIPKETNR